MAKIGYQTNEWGGNSSVIHQEIKINDKIIQITISDDKIHINGFYVECEQTAVNAVDVLIRKEIVKGA